MRNEDQKLKFEHLLEKKCKELEQLGSSLVFKEQEVLLKYKENLEVSKMDKNPAMLEKRALLEETDSEDDDEKQYARGKSAFLIRTPRLSYGVAGNFTRPCAVVRDGEAECSAPSPA